ncbi:MAG: ATP-binding cassette domain-containing protein [Desulfomonilia bacterium]|nr:ATP-binding cassette domain-containing protein [Desulfomonilia bacterium]
MGLEARIQKRLKHFELKVSLSCEDGMLLAIVGPSGAGKTTIVRTLAGLEKPDQGLITCGDEIWTDTRDNIHVPARMRGIGYVFQEFSLFPHLSVYKNVAFAARDMKTVDDLMRLFDIHHIRDSKPHRISGGERQRCAICQALARSPKVLLLDEPFSALDALNRRRLRELFKALKRELKIPIVHVTHDIREALFLADDILPVVQGRCQSKWILQFMLLSRETGRCLGGGIVPGNEEEEDIELSIATKEYTR